MRTPTYKPKCPICGSELTGMGFPLPKSGVGYCNTGAGPYKFKAEVDESHMVKDKDGNLEPKVGWKVSGPKH